ncbi:MAG: hypothetical protein SangKO_075880 [Sandaracinaceae bacterium]
MPAVTDSFDPEDYGRLLVESTRLHQECREGQQRAEDKIDALTAAQRETKKELDEMRESLKERAGERKSNARWWAAAFCHPRRRLCVPLPVDARCTVTDRPRRGGACGHSVSSRPP